MGMFRHVSKPMQPKRANRDPFWWWEDVEPRGMIGAVFGQQEGDDTVPDETPPYQPEPPIHAYLR